MVRIQDINIRKRIHYTYRLQYLKDVVLARILDDPTFSVLNSLIFYNQVDIVQHLHSNGEFLRDLFGLFSPQERDQQRKKNAVHFIQQCCAIAKNIQAPARSQLYTNFIQNGLFQVINFALRHQDAAVRIAGTDILVAMIDHDSSMMRAFVFKQITEKSTPLTDTLIELLLVEVDLGVKAQIADAIKVLLDPQSNNHQPNEAAVAKASTTDSPSPPIKRPHKDPQSEIFIQNFYEESARKLFKPLKQLQERESSTSSLSPFHFPVFASTDACMQCMISPSKRSPCSLISSRSSASSYASTSSEANTLSSPRVSPRGLRSFSPVPRSISNSVSSHFAVIFAK